MLHLSFPHTTLQKSYGNYVYAFQCICMNELKQLYIQTHLSVCLSRLLEFSELLSECSISVSILHASHTHSQKLLTTNLTSIHSFQSPLTLCHKDGHLHGTRAFIPTCQLALALFPKCPQPHLDLFLVASVCSPPQWLWTETHCSCLWDLLSLWLFHATDLSFPLFHMLGIESQFKQIMVLISKKLLVHF